MNLSEVRKARELGRKGHCRYIWHTCALCGRQRWTELRRGRPRYATCFACGNRAHREEKEEQVTQGHVCPPHYWLVDSGNVGRCKYCGEVKDFGELHRESVAKANIKREISNY
jgi:hypothetical protein